MDANASWWQERLQALTAMRALSEQITALESYMLNQRVKVDKILSVEMTLKRLDLELRLWTSEEAEQVAAKAEEHRAFCARTAIELFRQHVQGAFNIGVPQGKKLCGMLKAIGLQLLIPGEIEFGPVSLARDDAISGKNSKKSKAAASSKKGGNDEKEIEPLTFKFISLSKKSGSIAYPCLLLHEDPYAFQLRVSENSVGLDRYMH